MDFIGVGGPSAKPRGHATEISKREGVKAEEGIEVGHIDSLFTGTHFSNCLRSRCFHSRNADLLVNWWAVGLLAARAIGVLPSAGLGEKCRY